MFPYAAGLLFCTGCTKAVDTLVEKSIAPNDNELALVNARFAKFTIKKGAHYADQSNFKTIETAEMKFVVKFDSSAIYQSATKENQYDINKLYGFSDNNANHHSFSARFGWRWSNDALRLFGYIYNEGAVASKELASVAINAEIMCSIKVTPTAYIFTVDGLSEELPRKSTIPVAKGYQLYPYFGGDEPAPHDVSIWIKSMTSP